VDRYAAQKHKELTNILERHASPRSPWLPAERRAGPVALAEHRANHCVVCFPPAGAGAGFFRAWPSSLPRHRLAPVQLPGREERFGEEPMEDAKAMARAVAAAISAEDWESVVLLGYSFGALMAFETAYLLEQQGLSICHLIACARAAPQSRPQDTVADLPDEEFLAYVRDLGGLPDEVEAEPELIEIVLPILRADFRANDSYFQPADVCIKAPITTISGRGDPATSHGRDEAWSERTSGCHKLVSVDGGHFFILEEPEITFDHIDDVLASSTRTARSPQ
jgi:medium-chain acyl-[acyl-carrier-protein] hydrolase